MQKWIPAIAVVAGAAILAAADADKSGLPAAAPRSAKVAPLPQATASFGAVACGGWLYVYGGHIAPTHDYWTGAVSGMFHRLRLTGGPVWEVLPGGPAAQGLNLAAYMGKIYRVGGMQPHNPKGDAADLHSIDDAARFDPTMMKWESLAPLPTPRSSHDVTVVGDQLYVVGGWNLTGKVNDVKWAKDILMMDLSSANPTWTSLPQPFERRALAAASFDAKLYVIGGMNSKEVVERIVNIYDPQTKQWSEGPKLPEGGILGFSPAAVAHEGSLYVSVGNGALLRMNKAGTSWEKVAQSTPRLAHRLVSFGDSILVIGGADNGKDSDLIEAIPIGK